MIKLSQTKIFLTSVLTMMNLSANSFISVDAANVGFKPTKAISFYHFIVSSKNHYNHFS